MAVGIKPRLMKACMMFDDKAPAYLTVCLFLPPVFPNHPTHHSTYLLSTEQPAVSRKSEVVFHTPMYQLTLLLCLLP